MNIKSMVSKIGSIQYILHMPSSRNDRYWRHPSFKREKLIGFDETGATRLSSYVYGICLIHTFRPFSLKYEYPFLGRRQRKVVYLGSIGQYWTPYGLWTHLSFSLCVALAVYNVVSKVIKSSEPKFDTCHGLGHPLINCNRFSVDVKNTSIYSPPPPPTHVRSNVSSDYAQRQLNNFFA